MSDLQLNITLSDGTIANGMTRDMFLKRFPAEQDAWDSAERDHFNTLNRNNIRRAITQQVGDTETLLGTTADAAQLAVVCLMADIVSMSGAKDFASYKKRRLEFLAELAGLDAKDVALIAAAPLDALKSGEASLTASIKGVAQTLTEIMARATGVARILKPESSD